MVAESKNSATLDSNARPQVFFEMASVSCDSGNLVIIDPCYLKNSDNVNSLIDCGLATSINTEIGDGEFTVEKKRDRRGNLQQIVINIQ